MFPAGIAADYARALREYVTALYAALMAKWPEIEALVESWREVHQEGARRDAPLTSSATLRPSDVEATLKAENLFAGISMEPHEIAREVYRRIAAKVTEDLKAEVMMALESGQATLGPGGPKITGLSRFLSRGITTTGLQVEALIREQFITENVALIRSIPQKFHEQVRREIWDAVVSGKSSRELQKRLRETYNLTRARAELIARDQTGKVFGLLNRERQMDMGVMRFVWRTVGDNRVRESHRELAGRLFSWPDGHKGLIPGMDYQCRCWAQPVFAATEAEEYAGEEPRAVVPPPRGKTEREAWGGPPPVPKQAEHLPYLPSIRAIEAASTPDQFYEIFRRMGFDLKMQYRIVGFREPLEFQRRELTREDVAALRVVAKTMREMVARYGHLINTSSTQWLRPFGVTWELLDGDLNPCWGYYSGNKRHFGDDRICININVISRAEALRRRPYTVTARGGIRGRQFWATSSDPRLVGNDPLDAIRQTTIHEFGHMVEDMMPDEWWKELDSLREEIVRQGRAASIYSMSHPAEMFAEAWGIYHSPAYRPGLLHPKLEAFVRKVALFLVRAPKYPY